MVKGKAATKGTQKSGQRSEGFTAEERAAAKERVKELKAGAEKVQGERVVLEKISQMTERDRAMAKRVHALVKANAPQLIPRLWYGMPAYAKDDGKIVCHFQDAQKFKMRFATLGFSNWANLDEGSMWPTAFALMKVTAADEERIAALIKKAVS